MRYTIYSADSFRLIVAVTRGAAALSLVGASVEAVAASGARRVAASIDLTDANLGQFGVIFSEGALAVGHWQLQVRVTIGAETQTVLTATITVEQAAKVAP